MPSDNRDTAEGKKNKTAAPSSLNFWSILTTALGLAVTAVFFIYSYAAKNKSGMTLALLLLVAYVCSIALAYVLYMLYKKSAYRKELGDARVRRTEDFPLGILSEFDQPIAVCRGDGDIVWLNHSFACHAPGNFLISDEINILSVLDIKGGEIVPAYPDDEIDLQPDTAELGDLLEKLSESRAAITAKGVKSFGDDWTIHVYPHLSDNNKFYLLVLTRDTELNRWIGKYKDNLTHIAYIAIDNLEELAQSEQESYRTASTQVDRIIKEWASENGAFIKEYEREKYVMVLTNKSFAAIDKKRFDILERVSRIHIGSENLSVTVSIGVSPETGTLDEKEKSAQSAFEMALQRGGNQVVIMGETPKFYGAKALTTLKRSGVRHRVFADKLMHRLELCSNVIIMGHRNPDFDALGSCAGLARLALSSGKPTNIVANLKDPTLADCFEKLLRIPEYRDRVIFVDATEAQEKLTADTLVICSDVNNPDNIEAFNVAANANYLFIIDHHRQSEKTPEAVPEHCETLIVPSASSASELVSEILELELPYSARLHHEEADIMFAGILLDTKNFTRNTQVPTFAAAIYLRDNGADPSKAQALFKTDLDDFRQEGAFSTDLEIFNDCVVIAKETSTESSPAKRITAAKTADRLLNIKKIRASFVVAKMLSDVFISARSDGSVNVQLIMESLKGGGHYNAAATMLKEISVEDAVEKLKTSISLYFGSEDQIPVKKRRKKRSYRSGKKAASE